MLNLDTHVLLFALAGDLSSREVELLSSDTWSVSAIVRWEISKLVQLGRVEIDLDSAPVRRTLRRIHTWPLSWEVCRASCDLDIQSDPADEIIGATSVVHGVPLVTRDRRLRRSRKIPLAS